MKRRSFLGFLSLLPFAPSQAKKILDQTKPKVSFDSKFFAKVTDIKDPAKDQSAYESLENHTWTGNVCMDQYGGTLLPKSISDALTKEMNKG